MTREASVERNTKETEIKLKLVLDGTGYSDIETGVGFFDHMLDGFTRHGLFDLSVRVHGDLNVDDHHTIEDTGIVLGNAIKEACPLCSRSVRPSVFLLGCGIYLRKDRRYGDRNGERIFLCDLLFLWNKPAY